MQINYPSFPETNSPVNQNETKNNLPILLTQKEGITYFTGDYRIALLTLAMNPDALNNIIEEIARRSVTLGPSLAYDQSLNKPLGLTSANPYRLSDIKATGSTEYNPLANVLNTITQALTAYRQNRGPGFIPKIISQLESEGRIPSTLAKNLLERSKELATSFEENMMYFSSFKTRMDGIINAQNNLFDEQAKRAKESLTRAKATPVGGAQGGGTRA